LSLAAFHVIPAKFALIEIWLGLLHLKKELGTILTAAFLHDLGANPDNLPEITQGFMGEGQNFKLRRSGKGTRILTIFFQNSPVVSGQI
jgi:hypothetical protein